jgi:hypothetical protein
VNRSNPTQRSALDRSGKPSVGFTASLSRGHRCTLLRKKKEPLTGRARPPAPDSGPDERLSADIGEAPAGQMFARVRWNPRILNRSAPAACAAADHVSGATRGSSLRVASRAAPRTAKPKPAHASSVRPIRHCAGQDAGLDRLSSRRKFDIHLCRSYRERKRSISWDPFRWSSRCQCRCD